MHTQTHSFLRIFSQITESLLIGGGMFFQSQYEPLCLDISFCGIMNFSWNTKVSHWHTHTHTELLSDSANLIWVYLFLKKANSAGMCTRFYSGAVYILTRCFSFTAMRGCFISLTQVKLILCFIFRFVMYLIFMVMVCIFNNPSVFVSRLALTVVMVLFCFSPSQLLYAGD